MERAPARGPQFTRFLFVAGGILCVLVVALVVYGRSARIAWEINAVRADLRAGHSDTALERLAQLDRRYPQQDVVQYWLGVAYRRAGQLTQAKQHLEQAELLGWNPDQIALQHALIAARAGSFAQVERVLQEAMQQKISDDVAAEIYEAMAEGYVASFRYKEAARCLTFWREWQPQAVKPHLLLGALSLENGQREQAVAEYRTALELDPANTEARRKLGQTLLDANQVNEAQVEYLAGLAHAAESPELRIGLATCQRRLGQLDESAATLDQLLKERIGGQTRADVLRLSGELQTERGHYDEALRYLHSAEQLAPRDPRVHYALSRALSFAGQTELADRHQELFRTLRDSTRRLRDIVNELYDDPGNVELRYEAGTLLASNGFLDEAIGWWLSGLHYNSQHAPSHQALAAVYQRKGDADRAAWHQAQFEHSRHAAVAPRENAPQDHPPAAKVNQEEPESVVKGSAHGESP